MTYAKYLWNKLSGRKSSNKVVLFLGGPYITSSSYSLLSLLWQYLNYISFIDGKIACDEMPFAHMPFDQKSPWHFLFQEFQSRSPLAVTDFMKNVKKWKFSRKFFFRICYYLHYTLSGYMGFRGTVLQSVKPYLFQDCSKLEWLSLLVISTLF
jgi:hypothetical protein